MRAAYLEAHRCGGRDELLGSPPSWSWGGGPSDPYRLITEERLCAPPPNSDHPVVEIGSDDSNGHSESPKLLGPN